MNTVMINILISQQRIQSSCRQSWSICRGIESENVS